VVFCHSFNYKPGSKNWAINAEARLSDSEEANNIVYRLQEEMVNSGHRLTQVEMDLERMNAIINMYMECAQCLATPSSPDTRAVV